MLQKDILDKPLQVKYYFSENKRVQMHSKKPMGLLNSRSSIILVKTKGFKCTQRNQWDYLIQGQILF